jgi:PhnB protein
MGTEIKPVPDGYHSLTAHITVKGANKAIEFYKKAFGAKELARMPGPDGKTVMHAELIIGDSILMLNEEYPEMGVRAPQPGNGSAVTLHLYVENVDSMFKQAIAAGAKETFPLQDQFWGDRYGKLVDPFGHQWSVATHIEDVPPEEMKQRADKAMKEFGK